MSRPDAVLRWLEDASDWLSPIVVKEVRQVVRGREFMLSFGASLIIALAIAFFGAADALTGTGTAGGWTFRALMTCLTLLGMVVVPLTAFSALRVERTEQTLELMTLTALSSRRVVVGKLLAQAVKLSTLFAGIAPFIAMSFLLGGIDFVTILVSLAVLFLWSLWTTAAGLFLSSLFKTRSMLGLILGGVAILLFVVFGLGRILFFFISRGLLGSGSFFVTGVAFGPSASPSWWPLAIMATFCVVSMGNLLLLAQNRLSLSTEDSVTPLRLGFLAQFLLIAGWTLTFLREPAAVRSNAADVLRILGCAHLALVAIFVVTEDLTVPRRTLQRMRSRSPWRWFLGLFGPGGGRGAAYVLAQMALLFVVTSLFTPEWTKLLWLLAACGYICFFTGVTAYVLRRLKPSGTPFLLRVSILVLFALSLILPDLVYYVLWQPEVLNLSYSRRHLLNPIRTLANWDRVHAPYVFSLPYALGVAGLLAYAGLIQRGMSVTAEAAPAARRATAAKAGEPGSADVLY